MLNRKEGGKRLSLKDRKKRKIAGELTIRVEVEVQPPKASIIEENVVKERIPQKKLSVSGEPCRNLGGVFKWPDYLHKRGCVGQGVHRESLGVWWGMGGTREGCTGSNRRRGENLSYDPL